MSKAADGRRQKRAAEKKKTQKQVKHKERFIQPEPPCTIAFTVGQFHRPSGLH
jgi:hypothetical protein